MTHLAEVNLAGSLASFGGNSGVEVTPEIES